MFVTRRLLFSYIYMIKKISFILWNFVHKYEHQTKMLNMMMLTNTFFISKFTFILPNKPFVCKSRPNNCILYKKRWKDAEQKDKMHLLLLFFFVAHMSIPCIYVTSVLIEYHYFLGAFLPYMLITNWASFVRFWCSFVKECGRLE